MTTMERSGGVFQNLPRLRQVLSHRDALAQ